MDPQTKRRRFIGSYASEGDAARAYDCAAVQALGPGAKRNFPDEAISELPATAGEERKQRSSSRYIGVYWNKANSSWVVQLTDPQTKRRRFIGSFASEEDAARAYDYVTVQAHGPGVKRNFPGEAISEQPVTVGEERKQQKSSRYIGVYWHKAHSSWNVRVMDQETKRRRFIGSYASEEDAARAYDCAAVQAHGPGAERNFPGETISELPVTVGDERKQRTGA
jgi:AP2-like factor (ANT lineage)